MKRTETGMNESCVCIYALHWPTIVLLQDSVGIKNQAWSKREVEGECRRLLIELLL